MSPLSFRFIVDGETMVRFSGRPHESVVSQPRQGEPGVWTWVGIGAGAVELGVGAALLMGEEQTGCQPSAGL